VSVIENPQDEQVETVKGVEVEEMEVREGNMKKNKLILVIVPIVLLIISGGISFAAFSRQAPVAEVAVVEEIDENDDGLLQVANLPRDQVCPLNGALFTLPEREAWETRRPLAVMIENSIDSRPQSGLGSADIVFELVAEGGITRFMAIFYCNVQREDTVLAPIRSARTYFVNLASGFNLPMYVHVGGANVDGPTNALGQLADYGWNSENAINQFSVGFPTFVRDYNRLGREVATEHTMVTSTEKLWAVAERRGWTNMTPARTVGRTTIAAADWSDGYTGWTFVPGSSKGKVGNIAYEFWSGMSNYNVKWEYDASTNTYLRNMAGNKHVDLNTNEQIAVSNVVVMFAKETGPHNAEKHMMYDVIGKGTALVFNNGEVHEVEWSKQTRESELEFTYRGSNFEFTAGPVWVSVLDIDNKPTYN
jgi:hypothetical protein